MTPILWYLRVTEAYQRRTGYCDWQGGIPPRADVSMVTFLIAWSACSSLSRQNGGDTR